MKILVVGSGAVGGYFGGVLSRRGQDVTLLARGEHLEAIKTRGLRVNSAAAGEFTVRAPAVERPDGAWQADLILFCVKAYQNEEAIEAMRPAVGNDTVILTLQNGIGSGEQLAAAFGGDKVLLGAAYIDAARKAPGFVVEGGVPCRIVFGEQDGRRTARAADIRDVFQRAGIEIDLSSNIVKELWNKLIFICALSGMTCVVRAPLPGVLGTPETLDLTWRVMRETAAVAMARGVRLEDNVVETTMDHLQEFKNDHTSSMYLDLLAEKPLELQVLNGVVARIGEEVGVVTPVNDFITACLAVADNKARARRLTD